MEQIAFVVGRLIKYSACCTIEGDFISGHLLRVDSAVSFAKARTSVVDIQVAGRWESSQMPPHYAKAELAERGAIARFKEKGGNRQKSVDRKLQA
ncbi:hypothetical protein J4G02_02805 [Candidatus Poribacteria bacterium]|nr:hypothetical protein [Candidatus Poribacteria bacterium]